MPDAHVAGGVQRIGDAFAAHGRQAALMPYLMGGFPDLPSSLGLGEALAGAGADLIEVGVPFSDPLADGPTIQAAGERALAAGATFDRVLDEVAAPLATRLPVLAMCYANPLYARGLDTAVARLAASGVAGLIVPDLPAEESSDVRQHCDAAGLALVPLVAPTTPPEVIDEIAGNARGFVYVVSVTGVTGERGELPSGLEAVVARARAAASVPVAVGFGVGTPEMAGKVGAIADGVIIGTRLVRAIADAADVESGIADASDFLHACARTLEA